MAKRVGKKITGEQDKPKTPIKVVPEKPKVNAGKTVAKNTAPKKVKKEEQSKQIKPENSSGINKIPIVNRIGPAKTKRLSEDKYIKIIDTASDEEFKEMSDKIQNGTLQWAFYAVDVNAQGYHFYLVLK